MTLWVIPVFFVNKTSDKTMPIFNRQLILAITLIAGLFTGSAASSESVLLIHGYLSGSGTWSNSGVVAALEADGWQQAGAYAGSPNGRVMLRSIAVVGEDKRRILLIDLPSEAPVLLQADLIARAAQDIAQRHPDERITLVGHSAGGVAARAALVRYRLKKVARLITIASPHSGTQQAEKALGLSRLAAPMTMMPGMFGGDIARTAQRSQHLYSDLARPQRGNLLGWLNTQQHPDIDWVSIIHTGRNGNGSDTVVDAWSQDMNRVPKLAGHSSVQVIRADHALNPGDAAVLRQLLSPSSGS